MLKPLWRKSIKITCLYRAPWCPNMNGCVLQTAILKPDWQHKQKTFNSILLKIFIAHNLQNIFTCSILNKEENMRLACQHVQPGQNNNILLLLLYCQYLSNITPKYFYDIKTWKKTCTVCFFARFSDTKLHFLKKRNKQYLWILWSWFIQIRPGRDGPFPDYKGT